MSRTFDNGLEFDLVEVEGYSGPKLRVWTVVLDNESQSLFDAFLAQNHKEFKVEIEDMLSKLETMGLETGLKLQWVKIHEGAQGDGICALFDYPDKQLRLYFIRLGDASDDHTIILGGGGPKPKNVTALQDDEKLRHENYLLRDIAKILYQAMDNDELSITSNDCYSQNDYHFKGEISWLDQKNIKA